MTEFCDGITSLHGIHAQQDVSEPGFGTKDTALALKLVQLDCYITLLTSKVKMLSSSPWELPKCGCKVKFMPSSQLHCYFIFPVVYKSQNRPKNQYISFHVSL